MLRLALIFSPSSRSGEGKRGQPLCSVTDRVFELDDCRPHEMMMRHEMMSERGQGAEVKVKGRCRVLPVFPHAGGLARGVEIAPHLNVKSCLLVP